MKAQLKIYPTAGDACNEAARLVAEHINETESPVLTLAAGDTPLPAYERLLARASRGETDLHKPVYIGLDEWAGLGESDFGSCRYTMNAALYLPAGIPRESIIAFDGLKEPTAEARRVETELLAIGGLTLALLGVGINGHIGFNEPDCPIGGFFGLTPLSATTQTVGKKYFGGGDTPAIGASLSIAALKKARTKILLLTGERKADIAARILGGEPLPAAEFLDDAGAVYILDADAARAITA